MEATSESSLISEAMAAPDALTGPAGPITSTLRKDGAFCVLQDHKMVGGSLWKGDLQ